ncbi:MAG TPA: hypothetical protein PLR79_08305, partial [Acinetobacter sp.]|nr:hypothetical protein [Acinetobacter sp.]
FGDNAFELNEFLFIGHSLPDDQIGKGQIIVNLFAFYKMGSFLWRVGLLKSFVLQFINFLQNQRNGVVSLVNQR